MDQQDDDGTGHVLHQVNSEPLSNLGQGMPANATYPAASSKKALTKEPSKALQGQNSNIFNATTDQSTNFQSVGRFGASVEEAQSRIHMLYKGNIQMDVEK